MESLKELYFSQNSFRSLAKDLYKIYPKFSIEEFYQDALKELNHLELKGRINLCARLCYKYLPPDYHQALEIILSYCQGRKNNFYYLFTCEYVFRYGMDYWEESLEALRVLTRYSTAEEAIRYFLIKDFTRAIEKIKFWCDDENYHVRRLCSEGTRPRLPWTMQLRQVIENPSLTFTILERLKSDPEKYVQKSVANHINDISKDHSDWIVKNISDWNQNEKGCSFIIRHGMRSLVKQGHKDALQLLGFDSEINIALENLELNSKEISIGNDFIFNFSLRSLTDKTQKLVIDYRLYFVKKNNRIFAKTFKLSNKELIGNEVIKLKGKYSFADKTTRKHYVGEHEIEILVNGNNLGRKKFMVQPRNQL